MLLKLGSNRQKYIFTSPPSKKKGRKLGWIPILALGAFFAYKQISGMLVEPKAIIVLGGEEQRESFAAKFAQHHPDLHIWVSSGSPKEYAQLLFTKLGVPRDRVHLDYQAQDTVTNFTTLVDPLKAQGIDSVYLVTSDDHMLRARVIGEIVFGSRGIEIEPVVVPTARKQEPMQKCFRDGARAILWLATGNTGANLGVQKSFKLGESVTETRGRGDAER